MSKGKLKLLALALTLVICLPGLAAADTYGFCAITSNGIEGTAGQYAVNVEAAGGYDFWGTWYNQVLFTFTNTGAVNTSIADIYFDDGTLLYISSVINGPGVSFTQDSAFNNVSPANLPGGNTLVPPFEVAERWFVDLSADANTPHEFQNGVNPGEQVAILFTLFAGMDFDDTLAALANGDLRIGIHVQSACASDSFVNCPPQVPIPPSALLMGSGLLGLVGLGWRRRKG